MQSKEVFAIARQWLRIGQARIFSSSSRIKEPRIMFSGPVCSRQRTLSVTL